jgi:hypothetical protein
MRISPVSAMILSCIAIAAARSVPLLSFTPRGWFPIKDPYLLEDGFKITGTLFWLAYFSLLAGSALRK